MKKPYLKQFGDLEASDFRKNPVWVGCHTADYDETWYEDTDEETFRPWTGSVPVDPSDGMFLVQATAFFCDGSPHGGFLTPSQESNDMGTMQPQIFVAGERFGFWGGMFGTPRETRERFYQLAGKTADDIFPIRFEIEGDLANGVCSASVEGFYASPDLQRVEIET